MGGKSLSRAEDSLYFGILKSEVVPYLVYHGDADLFDNLNVCRAHFLDRPLKQEDLIWHAGRVVDSPLCQRHPYVQP